MIKAPNAIVAEHDTMKEWFEHMHRAPELSMQEVNTAKYIAGIVSQRGLEVQTGVAQHGCVA